MTVDLGRVREKGVDLSCSMKPGLALRPTKFYILSDVDPETAVAVATHNYKDTLFIKGRSCLLDNTAMAEPIFMKRN